MAIRCIARPQGSVVAVSARAAMTHVVGMCTGRAGGGSDVAGALSARGAGMRPHADLTSLHVRPGDYGEARKVEWGYLPQTHSKACARSFCCSKGQGSPGGRGEFWARDSRQQGCHHHRSIAKNRCTIGNDGLSYDVIDQETITPTRRSSKHAYAYAPSISGLPPLPTLSGIRRGWSPACRGK